MPMGYHYAREHVHTTLLYLWNGRIDCAQICYVSRATDMICGFDKAMGVSVHVRNCTLHLFLGSCLE